MDVGLIIQILYLFLISLILAALEIQIEGDAGWAANLPTWKPSYSKWYSKLYRKIMAEKDITGYHILVFSLVLSILHYPYFIGKAWSWFSELSTLSLFLIVCIVWDFLWFVLNPHYGFGRFRAEHILWHKKWVLFMPIDYIIGLIISALLYTRFTLDWILLKEWLSVIILFLILTIGVVIFSIITHRFKLNQKS